MNWSQLFQMQQKLDTYIVKNNQLSDKELFEERLLALLVELGELANETRCFKFWSHQDKSPKEDILEEYVDGLHFILSLGLEKGYTFLETDIQPATGNETSQFLQVFTDGVTFQQARNQENYKNLFISFIQLGNLLGFSEHEVQQAYYDKNKVNFQRQDDGY